MGHTGRMAVSRPSLSLRPSRLPARQNS
jgi:hypothetical protein